MPSTAFRQKLKPWMLPIAMVCGVLFHGPIAAVQWVVPYLIFTMLLITFCRVKPREFRLDRTIWWLLAFQIVGAVLLFVALKPLNVPVAQAVFICVLCPTATAAPVVTGMLGGSIAYVASYSIISNLATAICAPLLFIWVGGGNTDMSFATEFLLIIRQVGPLIVLPLALAFAFYFFAPKVHRAISGVQSISFYLWAVSLVVVVGRSVSFMLAEPSDRIPEMVAMGILAGVVCIIQFRVGRRIGRINGDPVSAGQGLAQKNTVLAIWMALTYLDPICSIGPAAYIAWQNTINSIQLYRRMKSQKAD